MGGGLFTARFDTEMVLVHGGGWQVLRGERFGLDCGLGSAAGVGVMRRLGMVGLGQVGCGGDVGLTLFDMLEEGEQAVLDLQFFDVGVLVKHLFLCWFDLLV